MLLYHGSPAGDLTELCPFPSNHDRPYVYLTDNPTLALLYAHNPIKRPGGFFPYYFSKDGRLHYDEYFADQLRVMYRGHSGYVYTTEPESLPTLDRMPWVHLSDAPVPVAACCFIPDLYEALLDAERAGSIILHRYESIPEAQQEIHRKIVRRSLEGRSEDDYVRFLREHMPEVFR